MSRKIYDSSLGSRLHCGLDLIKERARQLGVRVELTPDGKDLTRETEYAIYEERELTLKFKHKMVEFNGSPWGGSHEVDFEFTLSRHAQARMDLRCVTLDEVKRAFMHNLRKMEKAWISRNFPEYREYANKVLASDAKPRESKISLGKGDYIALIIESQISKVPWEKGGRPIARVPRYRKPIKVIVKTVWADGRGQLTRREIAQQDCVITLQDNGFELIKKAGMLRRAGRSDFSIKVSSKTNWLPWVTPRKENLLKKFPNERDANSQIQDPKHPQELMVSFDFGKYKDFLKDSPSETDKNMAEEFGNAVGAWVRENLVMARGSRYARNSKIFFEEGFTLDHLGVEYTLKPNTTERGHFNVELDFDLDNMKGRGADKVVTTSEETMPGAFLRGPSLQVCYITLEKMVVDKERELAYQSEVNRKCIDMLKDDYTIIDSHGERYARTKMARKIASIYVRNKRG